MTTVAEAVEVLRAALADELGLAPETIDVDADAVETYGLDSLDLVAIAIVVEERLGVVLSDDRLAASRTVRALAEAVVAADGADVAARDGG